MDRKGFGRHGEHGRGMRGDKGEMFGLRGIALTDVQKEQVRKIREANRPDESSWKEMRSLMDAKRAGTLTADQQERLKSLQVEQRQKGESVRAQIEAILTPEQRQQLETAQTGNASEDAGTKADASGKDDRPGQATKDN